MKFKVLPLLTGAIALSLSVASAIPAFAQSAPTTPATNLAHRQTFLNLTADQKAQMQQIHQTERTTIDRILTADQKTQLKNDRQNHEGKPTGARTGLHHDPVAALNLTPEQKTQIEAARRTAREQSEAVLTPDQRTQLQQHRQQHRQATPQAN